MIVALLCHLVGHRRGPTRELRLEASRAIIRMEVCPRCGAEHEVGVPAGLLLRVVPQGQRIPRGFGVAWVRWDTGDAVCTPVLLNVLVAAGRCAWAKVRIPRRLYHDPRQAFLEGYAQGLRVGRNSINHGDSK